MTEGGLDAALPDGSDGGPVTANVYCDQFNQLQCNAVACDNSHSCCGATDGTTAACQAGMVSCVPASATPRQYCCAGMACPNGPCPGGIMQQEAGVMMAPQLLQLPVGASPAKICP